MDQCTHEVRLQYWKNIISQCQARPAGQTAKQWMTENGIREQTYYLWQRRIRKETYEQMESQGLLPAVSAKEEIMVSETSIISEPVFYLQHVRYIINNRLARRFYLHALKYDFSIQTLKRP